MITHAKKTANHTLSHPRISLGHVFSACQWRKKDGNFSYDTTRTLSQCPHDRAQSIRMRFFARVPPKRTNNATVSAYKVGELGGGDFCDETRECSPLPCLRWSLSAIFDWWCSVLLVCGLERRASSMNRTVRDRDAISVRIATSNTAMWILRIIILRNVKNGSTRG